MDDKKSWFTQMEVINLICHQFVITAHDLWCLPTTFQFIQPLAQSTLLPLALAIYWVWSECATGRMVEYIFFHDDYQDQCYPSLIIDFTGDCHWFLQIYICASLYAPFLVLPSWNRHSWISVAASEHREVDIYSLLPSGPPFFWYCYPTLGTGLQW